MNDEKALPRRLRGESRQSCIRLEAVSTCESMAGFGQLRAQSDLVGLGVLAEKRVGSKGWPGHGAGLQPSPIGIVFGVFW